MARNTVLQVAGSVSALPVLRLLGRPVGLWLHPRLDCLPAGAHVPRQDRRQWRAARGHRALLGLQRLREVSAQIPLSVREQVPHTVSESGGVQIRPLQLCGPCQHEQRAPCGPRGHRALRKAHGLGPRAEAHRRRGSGSSLL
eukprot:Amastigsp_a343221_44.p2 type:complete len:142 gc:universal Amastigsp_a343221_44:538-113(-)